MQPLANGARNSEYQQQNNEVLKENVSSIVTDGSGGGSAGGNSTGSKETLKVENSGGIGNRSTLAQCTGEAGVGLTATAPVVVETETDEDEEYREVLNTLMQMDRQQIIEHIVEMERVGAELHLREEEELRQCEELGILDR